tara:strand:- start:744 stop:1031 length:288 start_codon:yes stop_codon:yes gene_type:complete
MEQTKYYTIEYVHDEGGVSIVVRPNGAVRSDYFAKTVAYVDFNIDSIHWQDNIMKLELAQEICNNLHLLHQEHLQYLDHLNRDFDDNGEMKSTEE